MTTDLDARLNLAASSLRRSVADLPLGQPRRPGRSPAKPVAVGLVVLLVGGIIAATVAVQSDDGPVALDVESAADVQALIVGRVPEGLQVAWAGEQSAQAVPNGGAHGGLDAAGNPTAGVGGATTAGPVDLSTYLYGDANADNPFALSDLVVNVWDSSAIGAGVDTYGDADIAASGLGAVSVRGHRGLVGEIDGLSTVRWYELQDLEVVLASQSLSTEQLRAIAEGLAVDGRDGLALGTPPAGLRGSLDEVARLGGATVAGARATTAKWIGYTGVGDLRQVVDVTTLAGGPDELLAQVWELGPTQEVQVRGQRAYMTVGDAVGEQAGEATGHGEVVELVWQEATDVLVHVTAIGMGQEDLLSLLEDLTPSTDDAWARVTELAATAQAAAAGAAETAPGALDGVEAEAGPVTEAGTDPPGAADDVTEAATDTASDLETTLHDNLGGAAIVGTVGSAVSSPGAGVGDLTGPAETGADAESGGGLVP